MWLYMVVVSLYPCISYLWTMPTCLRITIYEQCLLVWEWLYMNNVYVWSSQFVLLLDYEPDQFVLESQTGISLYFSLCPVCDSSLWSGIHLVILHSNWTQTKHTPKAIQFVISLQCSGTRHKLNTSHSLVDYKLNTCDEDSPFKTEHWPFKTEYIHTHTR
jgi:hypothetical protein